MVTVRGAQTSRLQALTNSLVLFQHVKKMKSLHKMETVNVVNGDTLLMIESRGAKSRSVNMMRLSEQMDFVLDAETT